MAGCSSPIYRAALAASKDSGQNREVNGQEKWEEWAAGITAGEEMAGGVTKRKRGPLVVLRVGEEMEEARVP